MFAQVVSGKLFRPDRFDELKAAFEMSATSGMKAKKGFQKAYLLQSNDNPGEAMVLMLWDNQENAQKAGTKADYLIQTQKVFQQIEGKKRSGYELVAES